MMDNKNSFFHIEFRCLNKVNDNLVSSFEDDMEPILNKMGASPDVFIYTTPEKNRIGFLFKTSQRKRISLLRNAIKKSINPIITNEIGYLQDFNNKSIEFKTSILNKPILELCTALTKSKYINEIEKYKTDPIYKIYNNEITYNGNDIKILNDRKNWYPWQIKFYEMKFNKVNKIKDATDREILFIEDINGNCGKSTFWKWLYINHNTDIGILSEASSSQIKANIVGLGTKKLYIIDLPRTQSESGTAGLINALESLKNGMINTSMYGSTDVLCMSPPWIVLTGNSMPLSSWTPDRWKVFSINNKTKDWKDISKEKRKEAKEQIIIEQKIQRRKFDLKKKQIEEIDQIIKKSQRVLVT